MTIRPDVPLDVVQVEHEPSQVVHFNISGPGASGGFRLYPNLNGPDTAGGNTSPLLLGVAFQVSVNMFLDGYWYWCMPSGQTTGPYPFALWNLTQAGSIGTLLPAANVSGVTLTPGAWTFAPCAAPVPLTANLAYVAVVGTSYAFAFTNNWWASGLPGWDGIANGPLLAYSDTTGSRPPPFSYRQCPYQAGTADPTSVLPSQQTNSFNIWLDVQVSTS